MSQIWSLPPNIVCQYCDLPLFFEAENIMQKFQEYFYGKSFACPSCKEEIDWWSTVLHTIKGKSRHSDPLMAVGARQTVFVVELLPNQPFTIRFSDYKIPNNAQILRVKYYVEPSHDGGLLPLEMHGDTPFRYSTPGKITLYPASQAESLAAPTQIIVMTLWVHHTLNDEAWKRLVESFDAFGRQDFIECIVPANVSVESTLTPILGAILERTASKKNVEDFLTNGATYSHQLNIILPTLVSFIEAPKLPVHIRGLLNRLRDHRNDIAHRGVVRGTFDSTIAAENVCAALFGFHYLQLIRSLFIGEVET